MNKICLNMIVKDEAQDIERCLASVKPYIDYYLIADTGSTDDTIQIIKKSLKGIDGEIVSHDWVNFGANRERILQLAYKKDIDYCLIIDADEELVVENKDAFNSLTAEGYYIDKRQGSVTYSVPSLISTKTQWHWHGVVHNYLSGGKCETLKGVQIIHHYGKGGKSSGLTQKEKYLRDAGLLEEELRKNPRDTRSTFYLAQSYKDAGEYELAISNYQKRVELGGWAEEVYYSLLQIAYCKWKLGDLPVEDFARAYNYRPSRNEALYELARHFRSQKQYEAAYLFASIGVEIHSDDILFVNRDIEEWKLKDELSISAYWTGRYRECERLCDELLKRVPEGEIPRIQKNREYAIRKLEKKEGYYNSLYKKSTDMSRYEEIYKRVGKWANGRVLDIGCGTAQLSKYVKDYHGFDFSVEALMHTASKNVWTADAYTEDLDGYDTYVSLEVLEHLDDLKLLGRIPKDKVIIFSVPSFSDNAHIRTYTEEIMKDRYKNLIDIKEIVRFNWHSRWTEGSDARDYILLARGITKGT